MLIRRLAPSAAVLSVVGLLAWLTLSEPQPVLKRPAAPPSVGIDAPERAEGSALACAVPLAWRVGGIDGRFGLTPAAVGAAIERAAAAWAGVASRPLFVRDDAAGFPIRIVYDERQARIEERQRLERALAEDDRRLESESAALTHRRADYARQRDAYDRERGDFERAAAAHADTVRTWNERGGAPPALVRSLQYSQAALDRDRERLLARGRELEAMGRSFQADAERYNEALDEQGRAAAALQRSFPPDPVESGLYLEAVRREGGRVVGVRREIRVFRFRDVDELQLVVAHELGHALGLGHVEEAGAVMSARRDASTDTAGSRIGSRDVELFRARCPELGVSASPRP